MTLEQYWAILLKQWKLVLICFLFVGLGTFIGSKLMTPVYRSSAIVQVAVRLGSNQADLNSLMASDQLVQTESALVTSGPVLSEVASHYPNLSAVQLAKEVSSTSKLNTQLFEIDVEDANSQRAANLANSIAATLIQQQQQALRQNNDQDQQQMQKSLDQVQNQINNVTGRISDLQGKGGNQKEVSVLQAQLNGLQQQYTQLQTASAQLALTQAQSGNFLNIVQSAQAAPSPVRPNVPLYTAIGLIAGLLLGMLLAVLYEQLDTHIRTPEALAQLLGWPVLTTVWRVKSASREEMINPAGRNINIEPYRILRTNIGFSGIDKPLRSLAITSTTPEEGKSVVAANLAIFMAKAGKSTLLIDADLRRPTQHLHFGLAPEKFGLSNALLAFSTTKTVADRQFFTPNPSRQLLNTPIGNSDLSLEPFVHAVGIPNLWVMPSGPLPPDPPELFGSKAMQQFLATVTRCGIEMVIFDTAPLLGLSDTSILVPLVDGILMVTDTTSATKSKLKEAKMILEQTNAHVLGCVANKQRCTSRAYYSYGYGQNADGKQPGNRRTAPIAVVAAPTAVPVGSRSQQR